AGESMLDPNVAVLDPSERLKSLSERIDAGFYFWIVLGECMQEHHAPHPLRLRVCREWPRRRRAAKQGDELAAPYPCDHSITSSAATSSLSGTVRPSALAVFILRVVSYLVGACTGRSAGLAPRRMRST